MTTFAAMAARFAASDAPAVISDGVCWSGAELAAHARGGAAWLDAVGAPEGTPVAALLDTGAWPLALVLGGAGSRRPLAPLGTRHTEHELAAYVEVLDAPMLVCAPEVEDLARAVGARAGGRKVEVVPAFSPSSRALEDPAPDAVAFVLHTSGTSGVPKPVPVRQDRLAMRTALHAGMIGLGPGSRYASASPFHHIGGLGMCSVVLGAGATVISVPRFSVEAWVRVGELGATHALLVPTMIDRLLAEGKLALPSLRILHYGTAPIHPDTLRRALVALPHAGFMQIYGQTEGAPITWLSPDDHRRAAANRPDLLATVGRAVAGCDVRVDAPDADGIGEVHARGAHLNVFDADGWLRTGDLGRLDPEGYLTLAGRKGDMIIRGGENVYPQEVEQVVGEHPGVREVAVVGIADQRWGEVVKAFVIPADPEAPPDPDDLRAFTRERLAGFKVPTDWAVVADLPRTPNGKVVRRRLREPDWASCS